LIAIYSRKTIVSGKVAKNLVFICVDQMRYDSLSATGNTGINTANLDRIAQRGMTFHGHHTPNQICSPSRATMATGLYPRHHGLTRNGIALSDAQPTVWEILKSKGLATHAVGKLHYQPLLAAPEYNMPESIAHWDRHDAASWKGPYYGFDEVELVLGEANESVKAGHYAQWLKRNHPESVRLYEPEASLGTQASDLKEIWKSAIPASHHYTNWIANRSIAAIQKHAKKSGFCIFVSFPDPHHPFSPPQPYCNLFDPATVPGPTVVPGELSRMPPYLQDGDDPAQDAYIPAGSKVREQGFMLRTDSISDDTMRKVIAHTYGSVQMIDDAVGRILDALDTNGVLDETYMVFTSDHGELLGDHGLLRKGPPPYRQLLQVPLLFSGPGIIAGSDTRALTSHLDFFSTLASLFDAKAQANDGVDLQCILLGEKTKVRDRLFAEYHPRADPRVYNQTIITDQWRFTCYPNEPTWGELFNLEADPWEHRNLFSEPDVQETVARLHSELRTFMPPSPNSHGAVLGAY
jgi:arylsulfatase